MTLIFARFSVCRHVRDAARRVGAIFGRDARLALSQPLGFCTRWLSPVIGIAGFYFVGRLVDPHHALSIEGRHAGYFAYVSVNLSFMLLQTSALQAFSATIRYDQIVGTLEPIFATATPASLFVAGCGLWPLIVSLAQVALSLGVAGFFMGLDLHATDLVNLGTFIVLGTLTMGAIGVLGAAGVVAFRQVPPSNYLVGGAASLLSGTLFPTHLFPPVVQFVSWCLPLTHALRGLRAAIAGDSVASVRGDAVWLGVAAALLLPAAFVLLHLAVERARRDGTLAHY